jgi:hypothetical protein
MNSVFRRRFEEQFRVADGGRVTKSGAITILMEIWRDLSPVAIQTGWGIYEEDFGPDSEVADADWEK